MIGDFLTNGRQLVMLLLDERIFGRFGKLAITGRLVSQVIIPIHDGLPFIADGNRLFYRAL